MSLDFDLLKRLPKVELHCHLDGSLRVGTMLELAKLDKVKLPTKDKQELKKIMSPGKFKSLNEYLELFEISLKVLQTPRSLERVAYELIEDVAEENVRYIEVRYSPILHCRRDMTPEDSIKAVRRGLKRGEKDFGVKSGIIICGIRNISPVKSLKLADLTLKYKNKGVVGFDLAGAEENFPAKDHRESFYLILNNNLNATIHAGEAFGPSSIHQALHYCGAHRIGHGTRLKEDRDLMDYVNDHRITMEICLTSNFQTQSVKRIRSHPIRYYYDKGLRITINTDNRLMSNTTLTNEYMIANQYYGFSRNDFREITITAMKSAFLHYAERKKLIRRIADELEGNFGLMPEFIDQTNR
ncbi:adenosine deaminase [Pseudomonadota bacterium]